MSFLLPPHPTFKTSSILGPKFSLSASGASSRIKEKILGTKVAVLKLCSQTLLQLLKLEDSKEVLLILLLIPNHIRN